jgi:hypothetical protein
VVLIYAYNRNINNYIKKAKIDKNKNKKQHFGIFVNLGIFDYLRKTRAGTKEKGKVKIKKNGNVT